MQPWALVTPASRGLGLEFVRRLLASTDLPVVATTRTDVQQTKLDILTNLNIVQTERLKVLKVDVLEESTIEAAASEARKLFPSGEAYLHLSLCIPGILYPEKSPAQIEYDNALKTFQTNVIGPMMILKHFSPFLPRKSTKLSSGDSLPACAVWANMSARVGSISDNGLGGWYTYRASKAAVNQLTKTFDNHLQISAGENAMAISLHPGTVKTDLSKEFWNNVAETRLFSAEYAVERLLKVIKSRGQSDRGKCWDWKGEEVPP